MSKPGLEVVSAAVHYKDVAASQTAAVLGSVGASDARAKGDYIERIIIVPETTGAGTIALLDGTVSRNIFVAGTLSDLSPIVIPLGIRSINGAWNITTGANVHVIAVGSFT